MYCPWLYWPTDSKNYEINLRHPSPICCMYYVLLDIELVCTSWLLYKALLIGLSSCIQWCLATLWLSIQMHFCKVEKVAKYAISYDSSAHQVIFQQCYNAVAFQSPVVWGPSIIERKCISTGCIRHQNIITKRSNCTCVIYDICLSSSQNLMLLHVILLKWEVGENAKSFNFPLYLNSNQKYVLITFEILTQLCIV